MRASVVAHGDTSPVLQPTEHVLDFVTLFVERFIVFVLNFAIFSGRDAGRHAPFDQGISEPVCIIAAIRKKLFCSRQMSKKRRSALIIADGSRRQVQQNGLARAAGDRVQL